MARLLVTGTRHASMEQSFEIYRHILREVGEPNDEVSHTVVVRDGDGVDFVVAQVFTGRPGWTVEQHEAEWEACGAGCPPNPHRKVRASTGEPYCPYAGPRGNKAMVATMQSGELCIALPERGGRLVGSGTWGTAKEAADAGLDVRIRPLDVVRGRGARAGRKAGVRRG